MSKRKGDEQDQGHEAENPSGIIPNHVEEAGRWLLDENGKVVAHTGTYFADESEGE